MKIIFLLLSLLTVNPAFADALMEEYYQRDVVIDGYLKGNTIDHKDEIKDAILSEDAVDEDKLKPAESAQEAPQAQEQPVATESKFRSAPMNLNQQLPVNVTLEEAVERGKQMREERQKNQR